MILISMILWIKMNLEIRFNNKHIIIDQKSLKKQQYM
jgi:hypothetical protein